MFAFLLLADLATIVGTGKLEHARVYANQYDRPTIEITTKAGAWQLGIGIEDAAAELEFVDVVGDRDPELWVTLRTSAHTFAVICRARGPGVACSEVITTAESIGDTVWSGELTVSHGVSQLSVVTSRGLTRLQKHRLEKRRKLHFSVISTS